MSGTSIVNRIGAWVARTGYDDLPSHVVAEAKNQVLSVLSSVHMGHFSHAGRIVSRTVKDWNGNNDATLIPSGARTSVHYAIFGNTALSAALECGDYLLAGHTGHSSVLVTLAMAEKLGLNGRDWLLAQVLANEVEGRIGIATMLGPLRGRTATFLHLAGAAVVAAKVMKLDQEQIESAIAIALAQPNFALQPAFFGSDAGTVAASMTAPAGVQAAALAANGLRGTDDLMEGPRGFLGVFGQPPVGGVFEGFGESWLTGTLSYKMYPCAGYVDSAIDCLLNVVRQHHVDAGKVRAVELTLGPLAAGADAKSAPDLKGEETSPSTLLGSLVYVAAVAMLDRELSARQFTPERVKDPAVWELASKVRVSGDEDASRRLREHPAIKAVTENGVPRHVLGLDALALDAFHRSFGARVKVEMEGERVFEMEQALPPGSGGRPFEEREKAVLEKFRRETRYTLSKERMEKAIDVILHLETASAAEIRELIRLCCSERG